jgi:hypothetical protein
MESRDLDEVEVRRMVEHPRRYERSHHSGHWLVRASRRGAPWIIVVRPLVAERLVEVVTVFRRRRKV